LRCSATRPNTGLCNKNDWAQCVTGTLLAQAVPADYAGDELLTNWTKPAYSSIVSNVLRYDGVCPCIARRYNPIMENTERDPSTPWKTSSGEWRLRTFNSKVLTAAKADFILGNG
jgi:hypothetical protein